jgi:uncharacterized NAD(P)/FAD-binding protein YdhS
MNSILRCLTLAAIGTDDMARTYNSTALGTRRPTVAVVGAGFSGLLTAVRLLAAPDGPAVRLIERRTQFGQGAAYSTVSPQHLLNIRAANMSAFVEWPAHFVEWLEVRGTKVSPQTYVTRSIYGEYLQEVLEQVLAMSASSDRLKLDNDEALSVEPQDGGGLRLRLARGGAIDADAVVLALGNLPPHAPLQVDPEIERAGRYVADPWAWDIERAPHEGTAVLFGTGLTMIDVALSLSAKRPDLKLLALSRRGLVPRRHLEAPPPPGRETYAGLSPLAILRQLRRQTRSADWRAVLDGMRPEVQAIWRGWTMAQRSRFLRHARPWWDVHRHRLSPVVARQVDHLTASGALSVRAGRALSLEPVANAALLTWRARASRDQLRTQVALAVNCTGPAGNFNASSSPLLNALQSGRLARADACNLGVDVDVCSRVVGANGKPNAALFAVGPITRGAYWEITSVPEIRVQAADCATHVLQALKTGRSGGC